VNVPRNGARRMVGIGIDPLRRGAIAHGGAREGAGRSALAPHTATHMARQSGRDLRSILERDGVIVVDTDPFALSPADAELVGRQWTDSRSKNSSYNPRTGALDGVVADEPEMAALGDLMRRYSDWALQVISDFFPGYRDSLELGRTSLRLRSVQDEPPLSRRKDDRSLHLDAFTSQPVAGRRILRVFCNIDPSGAEREWAIADGGFEDFARRFSGRARRLLPGEARVLRGLALTKSLRTDYDQIMLGMHDAAKRDRNYQRTASRRYVSFPQGATWLAFTDQTPHAAVSGQCALEQTFYVPVDALVDPGSSPLRVLERLWGSALA